MVFLKIYTVGNSAIRIGGRSPGRNKGLRGVILLPWLLPLPGTNRGGRTGVRPPTLVAGGGLFPKTPPLDYGHLSITTLNGLNSTCTIVLSPASLPEVSPTKVHFFTGDIPPAQ